MSNQEEIIDIAGEKVVVRYARTPGYACAFCAFCDRKECHDLDCNMRDIIGESGGSYAYFVLAKDAEANLEVESKTSVVEETDLEAEIKKMIYDPFYDLNGVAIKDATAYITVEDVAEIARHFAKWERARIESELRLAWGKISKDPFDADSVFKELLEHLKK